MAGKTSVAALVRECVEKEFPRLTRSCAGRAAAARNLIPALLEPGGKNVATLSGTDNLDRASGLVFGAAFHASAQRRAAVGGALAQRDQAARTKGYQAGQRHGRRHADGAASQPRPSAGCLRRDRQGHCGAAVPQAGGRAPDGGHPYRPASGMRSANASQGRRKSSAPFFRLSSTTASTRRSRC